MELPELLPCCLKFRPNSVYLESHPLMYVNKLGLATHLLQCITFSMECHSKKSGTTYCQKQADCRNDCELILTNDVISVENKYKLRLCQKTPLRRSTQEVFSRREMIIKQKWLTYQDILDLS